MNFPIIHMACLFWPVSGNFLFQSTGSGMCETFKLFRKLPLCKPHRQDWPIIKIEFHMYGNMDFNNIVFQHPLRLKKKKILCLKAAARICFSVRIWFCKIQTFIFFLEIIFFFHFYYEKRIKFAVLEEFKHVGAQKTCKIPFDFWKYGSWNFSVIFGFGCAWRQRPIEVKKNKIENKKTHTASVWKILASFETKYFFLA